MAPTGVRERGDFLDGRYLGWALEDGEKLGGKGWRGMGAGYVLREEDGLGQALEVGKFGPESVCFGWGTEGPMLSLPPAPCKLESEPPGRFLKLQIRK